tara:strand:+ start:1198 stop:2247 length:1050 start_codon:yes stop_codon:yes gene_type:complete
MGIFSKIKKGLKSIVKKVGRGIKKVAKGIGKVLGKIAKPFQKLGILGQIALSFIMPWAVGGIMKGMGYLASSSFGTFAGGLAKSSNLFVKAAGKLAQGINFGAAKINQAYTFISDGISKGLDWVGEQGAKLKKGITNKFDAAKEWVTGTPTYSDDGILLATEQKELFAGDDIFADVKQTVLDDEALKKQGLDRATVSKEVFDLIDKAPEGTTLKNLKLDPKFSKTIKSKGTNLIGDELVSEIARDKVTTNLLTAQGDRLIGAGNKAAAAVFTMDTAKNEIVKAAEQQKEAGYRPSYEEGPTVAYLEVTPEKVTRDIDFSVKSQGGQYMSPLDSAVIVNHYEKFFPQLSL